MVVISSWAVPWPLGHLFVCHHWAMLLALSDVVPVTALAMCHSHPWVVVEEVAEVLHLVAITLVHAAKLNKGFNYFYTNKQINSYLIWYRWWRWQIIYGVHLL